MVFGMSSSSRLAQSYYREDANTYNVAVYRAVPCDNIALGGRLGSSDLILGSAILLNPEILSNPSYRGDLSEALVPGTVVKVTNPPNPPNPPGGGS